MIRLGAWVQAAATTAWRERRDDQGGVSDQATMVALLVFSAVALGGIIIIAVTSAGQRLSEAVDQVISG